MNSDLVTSLALNGAQALGLMCLVGILVGLLRLRHLDRKDFLTAFIIFLFGTLIAQLPVHLGGMTGWNDDLIAMSAVGRIFQNLGAILYVRACLKDECGPWGWKAVAVTVAFCTAIL